MKRSRVILALCIISIAMVGEAAAANPAGPAAPAGTPVQASPAVPAGPETKPYDDRMLRLAEILGAIHFLRELCGANDGQYWRERMEELIRSEGPSALRQSRLTRGFNQGYRNYARTYSTCTPTAQTTITRFLAEGAQISDGLVKIP